MLELGHVECSGASFEAGTFPSVEPITGVLNLDGPAFEIGSF